MKFHQCDGYGCSCPRFKHAPIRLPATRPRPAMHKRAFLSPRNLPAGSSQQLYERLAFVKASQHCPKTGGQSVPAALCLGPSTRAPQKDKCPGREAGSLAPCASGPSTWQLHSRPVNATIAHSWLFMVRNLEASPGYDHPAPQMKISPQPAFSTYVPRTGAGSLVCLKLDQGLITRYESKFGFK